MTDGSLPIRINKPAPLGSVDFYIQLGMATSLAYRAPAYAGLPLAMIRARFMPAILLGQIEFFFDQKDMPTGLVTWAFLTDEVADRLHASMSRRLHISEWNEGLNLWVIDLVLLHKGNLRAVSNTLDMWTGHAQSISWWRAPRSVGSPGRRFRYCRERRNIGKN